MLKYSNFESNTFTRNHVFVLLEEELKVIPECHADYIFIIIKENIYAN